MKQILKSRFFIALFLVFTSSIGYASHALPLVNFNYTVGPTGVTISAFSNSATCGGGPYWMQVEVSCTPFGLNGNMPPCLSNTLTNWTNPSTSYVSYPFFNSLLNVPNYTQANGWPDQCINEPYNNVFIPHGYFCPGQVMYFRAREIVMLNSSLGPWTSVFSFTVPGTPPAVCSPSLTHSPATTVSSPMCPGSTLLSILNPNCPLACSATLAPSCITSTVYYKYYSSASTTPTITTSTTLSIPSVTATTTFTVFKTDSCGGTGFCPPKSNCNLPGGGWPIVTTVFVSTPVLNLSASSNSICSGNSVTLTASGATSYTWLPGSLTGSTVVVNPTSTTVYSVTGANINCSVTETISISVSTGPTITPTASSTLICSGLSTTLSASGASSYTWFPGNLSGTSVVVSPTSTTQYTVTGTATTSCIGSSVITVSVINTPTININSNPPTVCLGGSATLTASGATSYTWMPGSVIGSSMVVTPTISTLYTIFGAIATCTNSNSIGVSVFPVPTVSASASQTNICIGDAIVLNASGSASSYTWYPGGFTGSSILVAPSSNTTYTVIGTNLTCTNSSTVSVIVNSLPIVSAVSNPTGICEGSGSSATLSASGASSYTWIPGNIVSSSIVVTPTVSTSYTVSGTSAAGCVSNNTTVTIFVVPVPTVNATSSSTAICAGSSATLSASGALAYTWQPGNLNSSSIIVSPLVSTIYTVTGLNGNCTDIFTLSLVVNPNPAVNASASPTLICSGEGSTLTALGAISYTWNPGNITGSSVGVSPLTTSQYTLTGSNAFGCISTAVVNVSVNATPTIILSSNPTVLCIGNTATLSASGASNFTWNPGNLNASSVTVSPLANTIYTVTGESNNCTSSNTLNLNVSPFPTVTASASPTLICASGSATLSGLGATSYTWNPGNLIGANVVVNPTVLTTYTVTGSNGFCSNTATVVVNTNATPTIITNATPTNICSGSNSTVGLSASGATSYTWNPGSLSGSAITVTPNTTTVYTVTGTSTAGCLGTQTVSVLVSPTPTINVSSTSTAVCVGNTVGVSAIGATTYTWNPGNLTGSNVTVNPTSTTVYTVVGNTGICSSSNTISILVNPNPTVSATSNPTIICAGNNATLTGIGASSYTWMPGLLTGTSVVVSPTTTTIYTVTGFNGTCFGTNTVAVNINPSPSMTMFVTPTVICQGSNVLFNFLGVVSATLQPGNLTGTSVISALPSSSTIYTLTGSNSFGCTDTKTAQIIVNPNPTITVMNGAFPFLTGTVCAGSSLTLTAFGATNYTWSPIMITNSVAVVSPTINTTYVVTGSHTTGCSSFLTVTVNVVPLPTIAAVASPTLKCSNVSSTLTATGGVTYIWYPGALPGGTVVVNPLTTTNYTVVGSNGTCTNSAIVTLSVIPSPTINTFGFPPNICSGSSGTIGANGAISYTWFPGAINSQTIVVTPTATTIYTVLGTNGFGCTGTATRTVNVIPTPTINPIATPSLICGSGSSTLTVTGANNYTWNPGPLTGSVVIVSPTLSTTYTVTGNVGPCSNTRTVTVTVSPVPTLAVSSSFTSACANTSNTLTASGALTYTWMPGASTGSSIVIAPLVSTTYSVTGANAAGCTTTSLITINVISGPTVSLSASNNTICSGNTTTITPSGASNYTLLPGALSGTIFTVTPSVTTTYTVFGENLNGCPGINTIQIVVVPIPTINISASSSGICIGNTVTLTASGASSYTWLPPVAAVTPTITDTPTITTTYSVVGSNSLGCTSSATITVTVTPLPIITALSSATLVCENSPLTLIAMGATNYTWMPGSLSGGTVVANPSVSTTYTVFGNNGGCNASATVQVNVTPGPQSVTASTTGSITCLVSNVGLLGNTTSTNVSYLWSGPSAFTSTLQSPTNVTVTGTYSLTVTDINTGCSITATTAVIANTTIPNFSVTSSGNLGCINTVTLFATSSTSAGITYTWSGPSSFTSAIQNPTINVAGDYTVSAFDFSSGCVNSLTISVISNTDVPAFTATILPATCNGTNTNNDGTILISGNGVKYDYVSGTSYTGTATYVTATNIPTTGIVTNTLTNPTGIEPYTLRIYGSNGCFKDTTLYLTPVNCNNTVFGLTKAAGTPSLVNNKYQITYTITLVNASLTDNLTNVALTENLSVTFPLPTSYSVISAPAITSMGSSLTINPLFDGNTDVNLTTAANSTLLANKRDTIVFTVEITPNGFFGPFVNSVIGTALDINSLTVADSSNDGFSWDPDADGSPTNNNIPTVVNLNPNSVLGVAKAGMLSEKLTDNTYDVTYIVTVKNFGNDTLSNVQVKDNLTITVPLPAQYSLKSGPIVTGTLLTANSSFNGASNTDLLVANLSKLAPGASDTIRFTINVSPDTVSVLVNSAFASATNQFTTTVRDTSETGYNADPNGNGNPNETNESNPTIVKIPDTNFIIPEVFTPNGDGKNDFFVVKGLNGRKIKLIVFNRWGNKVFEQTEYDNTWDGTANVSSLVIGKNKLPVGTYYYVLEFLDGEDKAKTGFVVLQY